MGNLPLPEFSNLPLPDFQSECIATIVWQCMSLRQSVSQLFGKQRKKKTVKLYTIKICIQYFSYKKRLTSSMRKNMSKWRMMLAFRLLPGYFFINRFIIRFFKPINLHIRSIETDFRIAYLR